MAHLSAEDMLRSAVIEEKKFKHSLWQGQSLNIAFGQGQTTIRAKTFMSTGRPHHYGHLLQV